MRMLKTAAMVAALMTVDSSPAVADNFEIEHLPKVKHAGNVTVSPDGELTAYTLSVPRDVLAGDKDGRPATHLYIMQGDKPATLFSSAAGGFSNLQFSRDSNTLFFTAKRDDDKHTKLYSISMAGGEAVSRFTFDSDIKAYEVDADNTLFFIAQPKKPDNSAIKDKGFDAYVYEEDMRMAAIWQVSLDDAEKEAVLFYDQGHVSEMDLSDDGKTLIAAIAPTNLIDDHYMQRDLFVFDTESKALISEITIPGKLGKFELSDDAKYVAMHAGVDIHDPSHPA